MYLKVGLLLPAALALTRQHMSMSAAAPPKRLCVLGGSGYVGREVCKRAVERGWEVASLSRRGENPLPGDAALDCVEWISGDAADAKDVQQFVKDADAVVHAVGLLFDSESGLANLSPIVFGPRGTQLFDDTSI